MYVPTWYLCTKYIIYSYVHAYKTTYMHGHTFFQLLAIVTTNNG